MKPSSTRQGIWSLTKRGELASLAIVNPGHLLQMVKRT
jgi:hypothetical protein